MIANSPELSAVMRGVVVLQGTRVAACQQPLFDDQNLAGTMETTIPLANSSCMTEMNKVEEEGIPDAIPLDGGSPGWQDSPPRLS